MDQSMFEHYKSQAIALRSERFRLPDAPSKEELQRFLEIENAVQKFFNDIGVSGDAEADNVLVLQEMIGGPEQKEEVQRAIVLLSKI